MTAKEGENQNNSEEQASDEKLDGGDGLWIFERDISMVVALMVAIYIAYALMGILLGYDINGIVSSLGVVTFFAAVYAMSTLALNLHWGYTGLFNIGIAGFMMVGVYTMSMFTRPTLAATQEKPLGFGVPGLGMPLIVGIIAGMVAAALLGFLIALPALRLRADYLAIVTIAMSEIVRLTYQSSTFQEFEIRHVQIPFTDITLFSPNMVLGTGGGAGISTPDNPIFVIFYNNPHDISKREPNAIGEIVFGAAKSVGIEEAVVRSWAYVIVLLIFVAGFYWLLRRISFSPFGRVLKAIREDEEAANALGKNTSVFKVKVFMLGCALMGLTGILWFGSQGNANPTTFLPQITFFIWIALIIGGATSNTGSVLGAALFAGLLFEGPRYIKTLVNTQQIIDLGDPPQTFVDALGGFASFDVVPFISYLFNNLDPLRIVLMGVILIWLMQNRPEGLLGHRKEIASSIDLSKPIESETDKTVAADGGEEE